jgi:hypothetical protein
MSYVSNPKTQGSGILCACPQTRLTCPNNCPECFAFNGRSYLEPLAEHLPNLPPEDLASRCVVRMNDLHDSNVDREQVIAAAAKYDRVFFNTAIPRLDFPGPVVLTINSGHLGTDERFYALADCEWTDKQLRLAPPKNLMFVRLLTNTWNQDPVARAVRHWTEWGVPVILTFMAYHQEPVRPVRRYEAECPDSGVALGYIERKRTLNSYWAITTDAWRSIMYSFRDNKLVYSCGHIEGEKGDTKCRFCGNCLREYFATKERMVNVPQT